MLYEEPLKINKKSSNNLIEKWAKDLYRTFTEEVPHMANNHMKSCSKSLVFPEKENQDRKDISLTLPQLDLPQMRGGRKDGRNRGLIAGGSVLSTVTLETSLSF